jgi:hypothetical protein
VSCSETNLATAVRLELFGKLAMKSSAAANREAGFVAMLTASKAISSGELGVS